MSEVLREGKTDTTTDIRSMEERAKAVGLNTTILASLPDTAMQGVVDGFNAPKPHNRPVVSRETSGFTLAPLLEGSERVNNTPLCAALFRMKK